MLIREQGQLVKVMRVESSGVARHVRHREAVVGTFRRGEAVPDALLVVLTDEERQRLFRWLDAYHAA